MKMQTYHSLSTIFVVGNIHQQPQSSQCVKQTTCKKGSHSGAHTQSLHTVQFVTLFNVHLWRAIIVLKLIGFEHSCTNHYLSDRMRLLMQGSLVPVAIKIIGITWCLFYLADYTMTHYLLSKIQKKRWRGGGACSDNTITHTQYINNNKISGTRSFNNWPSTLGYPPKYWYKYSQTFLKRPLKGLKQSGL